MSRTYLAFVAVVSTLSLGGSGLAAQVHIRQSAIDPAGPQDYSTIVEQHIRTPAAKAYAPALDDATIVAIFDNANSVDIETGKLAAERGHSNEVRQFGAMLARDHEMVRQQGRDLANKLGVTATQPLGDQSAQDQAAVIRRLSALHGPQFDRAFLEGEVQFHKDVVAAIETTLLPAINSKELRAMGGEGRPSVSNALGMAENLLTRVAAR